MAKNVFSRLKAYYKAGWEKYPVLLFVLAFLILMSLFYAFMLTSFFQEQFQPAIVAGNAKISSILLNLFGEQTSASGSVIATEATSISVKRGCDALVPIFLYISAVLAFPTKWRSKIFGILWGILFLLILNIIRIMSLFWIQLYKPEIFDLMHLEVWQVLFIVLGIAAWGIWMQKSTK